MDTDSTTATADRFAVEQLARDLTDAQWNVVFFAAPDAEGMWGGVRIAALIAHLDIVWSGLSEIQRNRLRGKCFNAGNGATTTALMRRGLATSDPYDSPVWVTPLGRAVLRRAKEQGYA